MQLILSVAFILRYTKVVVADLICFRLPTVLSLVCLSVLGSKCFTVLVLFIFNARLGTCMGFVRHIQSVSWIASCQRGVTGAQNSGPQMADLAAFGVGKS